MKSNARQTLTINGFPMPEHLSIGKPRLSLVLRAVDLDKFRSDYYAGLGHSELEDTFELTGYDLTCLIAYLELPIRQRVSKAHHNGHQPVDLDLLAARMVEKVFEDPKMLLLITQQVDSRVRNLLGE
jgi:hypothetical protein